MRILVQHPANARQSFENTFLIERCLIVSSAARMLRPAIYSAVSAEAR